MTESRENLHVHGQIVDDFKNATDALINISQQAMHPIKSIPNASKLNPANRGKAPIANSTYLKWSILKDTKFKLNELIEDLKCGQRLSQLIDIKSILSKQSQSNREKLKQNVDATDPVLASQTQFNQRLNNLDTNDMDLHNEIASKINFLKDRVYSKTSLSQKLLIEGDRLGRMRNECEALMNMLQSLYNSVRKYVEEIDSYIHNEWSELEHNINQWDSMDIISWIRYKIDGIDTLSTRINFEGVEYQLRHQNVNGKRFKDFDFSDFGRFGLDAIWAFLRIELSEICDKNKRNSNDNNSSFVSDIDNVDYKYDPNEIDEKQEPIDKEFAIVIKHGHTGNTGKGQMIVEPLIIDKAKCTSGNLSVYGIIEANHGSQCAEFCVANLLDIMRKYLSMCDNVREAFELSMDALDIKATEYVADGSGASLCIVLIDNISSDIWCVNVGGLRAILIGSEYNATVVKQLTAEHKPDNPLEKSRIDDTNGWIINGKICNMLDISRAIGHREFKAEFKNVVISTPSITHHKLSLSTDRFICIVGGGLFEDGFSNETFMQWFNLHVNDSSVHDIAGRVCNTALIMKIDYDEFEIYDNKQESIGPISMDISATYEIDNVYPSHPPSTDIIHGDADNHRYSPKSNITDAHNENENSLSLELDDEDLKFDHDEFEQLLDGIQRRRGHHLGHNVYSSLNRAGWLRKIDDIHQNPARETSVIQTKSGAFLKFDYIS